MTVRVGLQPAYLGTENKRARTGRNHDEARTGCSLQKLNPGRSIARRLINRSYAGARPKLTLVDYSCKPPREAKKPTKMCHLADAVGSVVT